MGVQPFNALSAYFVFLSQSRVMDVNKSSSIMSYLMSTQERNEESVEQTPTQNDPECDFCARLIDGYHGRGLGPSGTVGTVHAVFQNRRLPGYQTGQGESFHPGSLIPA